MPDQMFVFLVVAALVDPIRLIVFGLLGVFAVSGTATEAVRTVFAVPDTATPAVRAITLAVCLSIAAGAAYVWPRLNEHIRLSVQSSGAPDDPTHRPFDMIRNTVYEQHSDRFVHARSEAETRAIIRRIDEATAGCRLFVGAQPEWNLWQRCRAAYTASSFVAGALQFALPAMISLWWRRRGHRKSRPHL